MSKLFSFLLSLIALVAPLTNAFAPVAKSSQARVAPLMAVKDISSDADFDALLKESGSKLVVVDYSTTWCGPCKVIAPKFDELSEKYTDAIFCSVVGDASAEAR